MKCNYCGADLVDGNPICPACGKDCTGKFCADCGAKMYQVRGKDWPTSKEHLVCATYRKINKPAVRALNYYLYKNFRYSTHTGI